MSTVHPTLRIGLVADDLTGAADSAVQFAEAGWSAQLLRKGQTHDLAGASGQSGVLAIATGVRSADPEQAAATTAQAVRTLRGSVDRLFLKIDSTARGSIDGQVSGALIAWQDDHPDAIAVICPAFPDLGRTVRDGQVLVNGRPVHQTAAAVDPVTPMTHSQLQRIIGGAIRVDIDQLESSRGNRLLCDAQTNNDLDALAAALLRIGPRAIAVGSAGLAAATARLWPRPVASGASVPAATRSTRVLVAVSSLHPTALAQVEGLRAATEFESTVELITTSSRRDGGQHAADIAAGFGDQVAQVLAQGSFGAMVLVGGDGASAVLDRLGVERIMIESAILAGTPVGRVVGGPADGLRIVTKSGGFGGADALITIVRRLTSEPLPPRHPTGDHSVPGSPLQNGIS